MQLDLTALYEQGKLAEIYGPKDEYLKYIEKTFDIAISAFKGIIQIKGDDDKLEKRVYDLLLDISNSIKRGYKVNRKTITYLIDYSKEHGVMASEKLFNSFIRVGSQRGFVQPRTFGQEEYLNAIKTHDLTICIGPAGTGKTYIAVARAVEALLENEVSRIIVTRPAVEAGEKLGFLPGDIQQKIDPYLKPIYDALYELLNFNKTAEFIEKGVIEIAPLAFMRGRTLNDSFIILDEGQNATVEQMKMFLTRIGYNSKAIIAGDVTQIDLEKNRKSGLIVINKILQNISGVSIIEMSRSDVVRHPLVQNIIEAFEKYERKKE